MRRFFYSTSLFVALILSAIFFLKNYQVSFAEENWKRFKFVKTITFNQTAEVWVQGSNQIEIEYTSDKDGQVSIRQNDKAPGYILNFTASSAPKRILAYWSYPNNAITHFYIFNTSFATFNIKGVWLYGATPVFVKARVAKTIPLSVAFGDSIMAGISTGGPLDKSSGFVDLLTASKGWRNENLAMSGQSATCYGQNNVQKVIDKKPSTAVFIGFGTNDITGDFYGCKGTLDDFRNAMTYILTTIKSGLPNIPIYVQAIIPRKTISSEEIASWNQVLQEVAASASAKLIDPSSVLDLNTDYYDNLHPNSQGHQKITDYWLQNM